MSLYDSVVVIGDVDVVGCKCSRDPWSQRTLTEMSGCGLRSGNMCALHAVGGTLAKGIWVQVVCVDEMDSPLGS